MQYDSYTYQTMDSAYNNLRDTFEDLKEGKLQADNERAKEQLENACKQIVAGAQTLYIFILEMQNARDSVQRQLDAMDRFVAKMELRYKFGQIFALTLEQVKNGRAQV